MKTRIVFTGKNSGRIKGVGGATFLLLLLALVNVTLSPALKAQTKAAPPFVMQVEVGEIPASYGLRSVILMNPGDMERLGFKGGERVRACNKCVEGVGDTSGSNCVIVTVEYGAGVVSGNVMMDIDDINSLGLSPGDRFTMELTPY